MDDFKERARDAMDGAREKAKDAMDGAVDIARDQLDTFKKLTKTGQKIVIGVIAAVAVVIILLLFWPSTLDVTVERIVEPVIGNSVVVSNHGKFDLGKTKIILNDVFETTIDSLPPDATHSTFVVDFHMNGDPNSTSPGKDAVPNKIEVHCKKGTVTKKFPQR